MAIVEFIKAHQLNFMLIMIGVCGTLGSLTLFTGGLTHYRAIPSGPNK